MASTIPSTCETCGGTGLIDDDFCPDCGGQSSLPVHGLFSRIVLKLLDIEDKCNDILGKCNDIFEKVNE